MTGNSRKHVGVPMVLFQSQDGINSHRTDPAPEGFTTDINK